MVKLLAKQDLEVARLNSELREVVLPQMPTPDVSGVQATIGGP